VGSKDQSVEEQDLRYLKCYMKHTRYIYLKNEIMDILAYLTTLHYLKLYRMIQNFDVFRVYIKEFI